MSPTAPKPLSQATAVRPTVVLCASGQLVDLIAAKPESIDFRQDVSNVLARLPRFNGHPPAGPYSVAQHSLLGARAIMDECGDARLAQLFILHDAHEYVLGDITRPAESGMTAYIASAMHRYLTAERTPNAGGPRIEVSPAELGVVAREGFRQMKRDLDIAIFKAAGVPLPTQDEALAVADWDTRMLRAEADALFRTRPSFGKSVEVARPVPLRGRIKAWPWPEAADKWFAALTEFCPQVAPLDGEGV